MFRRQVCVIGIGLLVIGLVCLPLHAQGGDDRIGLAEEFDTMTGWKVTREQMAGMTAENGVGVFETYIKNLPREINGMKMTAENFLKVFKPGLKNAPQGTGKHSGYKAGVYKRLGVVDLDKFHYLVMKTDLKPVGAFLELKLKDPNTGRKANHEVQVAHSSGVISQDLKLLGIGGKKEVGLYLEVFNTGRKLKVDYIRLVSRLTEEEKAGLIPAPITLPSEKVERHPYQKLEALWRRAPRPWAGLPKSHEEKALFHDVGTGMPIWRMTATTGAEGMVGSNKPWVWRADGSSMSTPGRTYYFDRDSWSREGMSHWKSKAAGAGRYRIDRDRNKNVWRFSARDPKTGKMTAIHEHPFPKDRKTHGYVSAVVGNRLVAALIGAEVVVVDVPEGGGKPKVKTWPLPPIGAKGRQINEKYLSYRAPFMSLHRIRVSLDTGEITKGVHHTLTHGMYGKRWRIMTYDGISKVLIAREANRSDKPGKALRMYGVYKTSVVTDYGEMTSDDRYGITNGTSGELAGQYVLFDRLDAGTVLRLCTYNVSYHTWSLRAKVKASPDYTKLAYASDMMGDADYYVTVIRRPDAPRNVKARKAPDGVRLTWGVPTVHAETRGYNVYRSSRSGLDYKRINKELISATEFTDKGAPAGAVFYLVTAEERSGLTSLFSPEVRVGFGNEPIILHSEAEDAGKVQPMREFVDGRASGYRAVRLTRVRPTEDVGSITLSPDVPRAGKYRLWGRIRHFEPGKKGKISVQVAGRDVAALSVPTDKWTWVSVAERLSLSPGGKITLASADQGVMIDKIIVTDSPDYQPKTTDDRKAAPKSVTGLKVAGTTPNSVELAWDASADPDIHCYSVYVGDKPDFVPGNETLLCSTQKTTTLDWGIRSAARHCYKVVAIDKFGNRSAPVAVEARTETLEVATKALPATEAKATPGMIKGIAGDTSYVEYPGQKAGEQSLSFDFDVPAEGAYYVWMKYTPTFNQRYRYDNIGISIDGEKVRRWGTKNGPPRGQGAKPGRWFVQRLQNRQKLSAGKHSLKLLFQKKDNIRTGMGQRIADIWVTNDASFVPPGYTAQVMFKKPAPWKR